MKKTVALLVSLMLLVGCITGIADEVKFKAGTYEAAANGKNGAVCIEVVFTDSKIESIKVLSHQETPKLAAALSSKSLKQLLMRSRLMWILFPEQR